MKLIVIFYSITFPQCNINFIPNLLNVIFCWIIIVLFEMGVQYKEWRSNTAEELEFTEHVFLRHQRLFKM